MYTIPELDTKVAAIRLLKGSESNPESLNVALEYSTVPVCTIAEL